MKQSAGAPRGASPCSRSCSTADDLAAEPLRLAVIGDPVAHSASPALHRAFLRDAGLDGTYEAIRVASGDGAAALDSLRDRGFRGVNVTTPLKEEAFAHCGFRDAAAAASGSVNTVVFDGRETRGYDTDGVGAVAALRAALRPREIPGSTVLVLGAGPTARSAVFALVSAGARVVVWNRTRAKAEELAGRFGAVLWRHEIRADAALSTLAPMSSPGDDELRASLVSMPIVVDANYGDRATLGAVLGRPVIDGLQMLRAGARASFDLFARVR
jgi:shikimate dehydrogenase